MTMQLMPGFSALFHCKRSADDQNCPARSTTVEIGMVAVQKMRDVSRRAWWRGRRAWRHAANAISNAVFRTSTLSRPQL
jgi:hypothetical protein